MPSESFAGSASCQSCHKDIYEKHLHTAHYLTTRPADSQWIRGSFQEGRNRYYYNASVVVAMEKRADSFYQVEYFREQEKKAHPFHMVVGSGTMGQSFLYWSDHKLFQLPITYFTAADAWSNSPGFPDKVVFNRVITSRCLECHATYAQVTSADGQSPETFNDRNMVLGVDCEKCHGSGIQHVAYQQQHPSDKSAKFIINPSQFTRQQNLDLCASCHGGRLQKLKPSFTFHAGDRLSDYFSVDTSAPDPQRIDVHGNQYGLLRASACFRQSLDLTCNSCHDVHQNEKGRTAVFSQRCMNCHDGRKAHDCPLKKTEGAVITKNCVDCHMPLQESRAIAVQLEGSTRPIAARIRSHYIKVYPEESERLLPLIRKQLK